MIIELYLNYQNQQRWELLTLNSCNSHLLLCVMYVTFFTFKIFNIIYTGLKPCFKMVIEMFYKVAI